MADCPEQGASSGTWGTGKLQARQPVSGYHQNKIQDIRVDFQIFGPKLGKIEMKKTLIFLFLVSNLFAQPRPYPIYSLSAGKVTNVEPWLLPQDGFETLKNCHLKYGVLEKRRGYSEFGQMVHVATDTKVPTLKTDPIMGIWNYYSGSTEQLMIMDADRVGKYVTSASVSKSITAFADAGGGEVTATSTAHGFDTDDIVTHTGTTNYNGSFSITKVNANSYKFTDTWVADDATGTASQEYFIDLTRNKIRFKHASKQNWTDAAAADVVYGGTSTAVGTIKGIIVDTGTFAGTNANGTIIFENGSVTGTFQDGEELQDNSNKTDIIGEADGAATDDIFTGDNTNFFWVENWNGISYITNDNDVIQKYNGTDLSRLHIDLDVEAGPDNDITRCKFIFLIKSRLVIFEVTEKGTTYRQRARWCDINDPDTWKNASYIDADTDQWIIAADLLGDDLIVFFERSVWKFSYTADSYAPFRWDRIDAVEGCYAPMSLVAFSDEIFGVGPTALIGTDGREAYTIDEKIPDFVISWNVESVPYCYGLVIEEERQAWITYASSSASAHADGNVYPDKALILNYDDNSYSTYTIPAHSLGYSTLESDITWNDVGDAWEDIDWAWDEKSLQAGYPTTLMGCRDGKIYTLNNSGADDGEDIEFEAIGGRWNPFFLEGKKAWLSRIDFLVDIDSNVSFDVLFYKDTESSAYKTSTITCTAVGSGADKTWHRVNVNQTGTFHRIEITNDASNQRPRIHCIIPYMQPAGPIY